MLLKISILSFVDRTVLIFMDTLALMCYPDFIEVVAWTSIDSLKNFRKGSGPRNRWRPGMGQQQLDVEHLLLALIEQEGGLAQSILLKAEVNLEALHRRLTQELDKLPRVSGSARGDGSDLRHAAAAKAADARGGRSQAAQGRVRFGRACVCWRRPTRKSSRTWGSRASG